MVVHRRLLLSALHLLLLAVVALALFADDRCGRGALVGLERERRADALLSLPLDAQIFLMLAQPPSLRCDLLPQGAHVCRRDRDAVAPEFLVQPTPDGFGQHLRTTEPAPQLPIRRAFGTKLQASSKPAEEGRFGVRKSGKGDFLRGAHSLSKKAGTLGVVAIVLLLLLKKVVVLLVVVVVVLRFVVVLCLLRLLLLEALKEGDWIRIALNKEGGGLSAYSNSVWDKHSQAQGKVVFADAPRRFRGDERKRPPCILAFERWAFTQLDAFKAIAGRRAGTEAEAWISIGRNLATDYHSIQPVPHGLTQAREPPRLVVDPHVDEKGDAHGLCGLSFRVFSNGAFCWRRMQIPTVKGQMLPDARMGHDVAHDGEVDWLAGHMIKNDGRRRREAVHPALREVRHGRDLRENAEAIVLRHGLVLVVVCVAQASKSARRLGGNADAADALTQIDRRFARSLDLHPKLCA
eukprot:scaffold1070_cov245-Pinguiococcus_pyrenoidosus.AAC.38